jgi:hypothetical protein
MHKLAQRGGPKPKSSLALRWDRTEQTEMIDYFSLLGKQMQSYCVPRYKRPSPTRSFFSRAANQQALGHLTEPQL